MSFQAMAAVSRFRARNSTEKLLLYGLANYADEDGVCFPSQAKLAADGSMGERTVRRVLADLEEQGLVQRSERKRRDGTLPPSRLRTLVSTSPINPPLLASTAKTACSRSPRRAPPLPIGP